MLQLCAYMQSQVHCFPHAILLSPPKHFDADFFSTAVDARFFVIVGVYLTVYFSSLFSWATLYYGTWRCAAWCSTSAQSH